MINAFIKRWESSAASERANYQLFLTEFCAVLEVEPPQPAGADDALIRQTAWQQADGAKTLARHFTGVRAPTVQRLVDALAALGHVG